MATQAPIEPLAVSIPKAAAMLGVHRHTMWRAVDRGDIRTVRFGRRRLVPVAVLHEFIQAQMCEEPESPGSLAATVVQGDDRGTE